MNKGEGARGRGREKVRSRRVRDFGTPHTRPPPNETSVRGTNLFQISPWKGGGVVEISQDSITHNGVVW